MAVAQGDHRRARVAVGLAPPVEQWFAKAARDLPWRRVRTAYGTLVSEAMCQQTQVARAAPAWTAFMRAFPTIQALAEASEGSVLEAWRGLGYYRRARSLHAAAAEICELHGGMVPSKREALLALPGIGPYCAGAIGSIAFGKREPIVDGNVARVLMRVHGRNVDGASPAGSKWLWARAKEYVDGAKGPGIANEGLMELGATICTPVGAACARCPLRKVCVATKQGSQDRIPLPRKRAVRQVLHAHVIVARVAGHTALVRRGEQGLWAGMLFPPTVESPRAISKRAVALKFGVAQSELGGGAAFEFMTSHRAVRFRVWCASDSASRLLKKSQGSEWTWHSKAAVARASLSSAMCKVFESAKTAARARRGRVVLKAQ